MYIGSALRKSSKTGSDAEASESVASLSGEGLGPPRTGVIKADLESLAVDAAVGCFEDMASGAFSLRWSYVGMAG